MERSVSRDQEKLRAFKLSDELVIVVYKVTSLLPAEEKFGLISQIRRAAVSVPTNLVEGSVRASQNEFARFVEISLGSASEVRYLLSVARRLAEVSSALGASHIANELGDVEKQYLELVKMLNGLNQYLRRGEQ
jgi:four helix bundle protein